MLGEALPPPPAAASPGPNAPPAAATAAGPADAGGSVSSLWTREERSPEAAVEQSERRLESGDHAGTHECKRKTVEGCEGLARSWEPRYMSWHIVTVGEQQ